MVFLILFLSFSLKNDAFLIGFKSFLILFSYSFYLFYSFLMHYGCIFSQTLVGLYDYSFFLCCLLSNFPLFTAFLCIMHLISLCFSLIIAIFSYYYLYRCTPVNRSLHSSRRFFLLQCTGLFTGVQQGRRIIFFTILQLVFYFYIIDYQCIIYCICRLFSLSL